MDRTNPKDGLDNPEDGLDDPKDGWYPITTQSNTIILRTADRTSLTTNGRRYLYSLYFFWRSVAWQEEGREGRRGEEQGRRRRRGEGGRAGARGRGRNNYVSFYAK